MTTDAGNWLQQARDAVTDGRFAEALEAFRTYHERSRSEPSQAGVRLSTALTAWADLGRRYPPAQQALGEVRQEAAERLLAGPTGGSTGVAADDAPPAAHDDFAEVAAISTRLGDDAYPVELFARLDAEQPAQAAATAIAARRLLVRAGRFDLAQRYLHDPERRVGQLATILDQRLSRGFERFPEERRERLRHDTVRAYVDDVRELLAIYAGVGEVVRAETIRRRAIEAVPWAHVREDVEAALTSGAA
jgi:hypothetical protein